MTEHTVNEFNQPVGQDLDGWTAPDAPPHVALAGRTVRLEPMNPEQHSDPLFAVLGDAPPTLWTYLPWGPYDDIADFTATLHAMMARPGWQSYTVMVDDVPVGFCSYLRIDPPNGAIEIGGIVFSPVLQQTTAATEALTLLIRNAFALGYRRCEWKCDDLNAPSRRAAERLGFTYEGTWSKATHYKGRNRDTSWYAIVDDDASALTASFDQWLDPANFDTDGRQRQSLESFRTPQ